ncbi:hypothetical protein FACS189450_04420 [Spirochaetia bacterium]|nr:hypothetical protein FACS189450_04420 [Spirochaetia bacterium]
MKDDTFFVPVLERGKDETIDCSLYHVHAINAGGGGIIGVAAFGNDLTECFKNLRMEVLPKVNINILRFSDKKLLENLTENTRSIFLGLFLQVYRQHFHLEYKKDWDSITVTGDLDPGNGKTNLKGVAEIDQKYKGVLRYADELHDDKKNHLFLYVTEGDEPLELEQRPNIAIQAFNQKDSLFKLLYFLFGPTPLEIDENRLDDRQKILVKHISNLQYIRPEGFYAIEEHICDRHFRGYFIHGEGDTGKSVFAMALSAMLLNRGMIYAPLWIRVSGTLYGQRSDSPSQNTESDDYLEDYNNSEEQYLMSKIYMELTGNAAVGALTSVLGDAHYVVVLDNLEFSPDKIKKLLNALKNVIASCFRLVPYIIVTSRSAGDEVSLEGLGIVHRKAPELSHDSLADYIDSLVHDREYRDKIEQNRQGTEYRFLLEELHTNYRWYPGIIKTLISLLRNEELSDLLVIAKQFGTGQDAIKDKQEEMFYKAFMHLDKDAQYLLFTLMGMSSPGGIHERDELFRLILDRPEYPKKEETRKRLGNALRNLLDSNFIYREQNTSCYGIKTLPYLLFMFNDKFTGLEQEPGLSIRDYLLKPFRKLYIALEYDQPYAVVKNLMDKYSKEELNFDNDSFMHAAEKSSSTDLLDLFLERGCDIDYIDEFNMNSLITAAALNPNVNIMEWFFEHNVDISHRYEKNNAFHLAAANASNHAILECMLKHGFKITDKGENGLLPFFFAAKLNRNTVILDFFASQDGFDINVKIYVRGNVKKAIKQMESYTNEEDEEEESKTYALRALKLVSQFINKVDFELTPIYLAAYNPNVEILRWFFDHNALRNELSDGSTLLNVIAKVHGNPAFLELLKEYGYDIMEKTEDGLTALHLAAFTNGSIPVFEWFKNNGLDINAGDDEGSTPLRYACMFNPSPEVLDWFIRNGAIFSKEEKHTINDGFKEALLYNHRPVVFQWFLNNDADINAIDSDGDTILHVAAQDDCPTENILWMLDHGADPDICNNEGVPAIDYLQKRDDWSKIKKYIKRNKK